MSSFLKPSRLICPGCLHKIYGRQSRFINDIQWRTLSTTSSRRQQQGNGANELLGNSESGSRSLRLKKHYTLVTSPRNGPPLSGQELAALKPRGVRVHVEQAPMRERPRGRIRGGRARIRKDGVKQLEELSVSHRSPDDQKETRGSAGAAENLVSQRKESVSPSKSPDNTKSRKREKIAGSTEAPESKELDHGIPKLPSITSIVRPIEMNWYWETFPPTFQERSTATHFFMSTCANNPPKLLTSAARFMQVPDSDVPEVAFVGRSNVGKSSLLNAIVNADMKKLLAKTSATPGFTKTMNFYGIGPSNGVTLTKKPQHHDKIVGHGGLVLVDMPGYGEGSLTEWGVEIMKYIQSRKQLRRVFVLLDAEHGVKDKDRSLLASLRLAGVSHQIILSKVDKLYIPPADNVARVHGKSLRALKSKGSIEDLRKAMEPIKKEIQPPTGAGALGEILACSAETVIAGQRFGIDHVRYAVLKAVGLERSPSRPGKRSRVAAAKKASREDVEEGNHPVSEEKSI